ncbi:MFS general substrate transporter [Thelephora ganbajun]|uniref:MFS general substrate transporter n=1 Tax=Thelephora ganbajun TaxID=370292 RepID=A0ACB6ZDS5_THEGA|nr:MFS general substrate transporter [Thelephora ganbajun]
MAVTLNITAKSSVSTLVDIYDSEAIDPEYQVKSHAISCAIQQIGMGRYQWWLFVVAGFGWFSDSVWPLLSGLILTPVVAEFGFKPPYLSLALNTGLFVGAVVWGIGCDVWGRRWSFNATLFLTGVFGLASGGSGNFITLASLFAVCGFGVGGNLPVDSAVFLDLVPASHQYLLTVMSGWWSGGQLLGSLVAWPLIVNFSCHTNAANAISCARAENMGWRYLMFTLGGLTLLMWFVRFFVFRFYESPRYLIGRGRDEEAVEVIHRIAKFNGKADICTLTVGDLQKAVQEQSTNASPSFSIREVSGGSYPSPGAEVTSTERKKGFLSSSSHLSGSHIKALFATRRMAWSTSLLIVIWGTIGLASTLYNSFLSYILSKRGEVYGDGSLYTTYRNQVILSVLGVPGCLLAGWAVQLPHFALTGVFLFGSTTARSSDGLLGWNCGYAFCSNIMYGVLYAISPEIFPAKDRGTGNGLTATATRLFAILSPIIALYADLATAVPVYVSGGLILFAGTLALALPFEPCGKASL